ncbi:hypothetical protein I5G60_gp63 [Mycobacterium phage Saguaro]|uniref:Uncharacterized protein n=1 Tax=Mycobacterium phage Saguaro TaxID=2315616 RepID=A0A386KAH6_9CAUD|nr:hypothetical protein I5G60_gp63 [Mycobacterium phage Saguaro]AYD82057.1 hypothetical protein SEA_SAGUARO_63 [Mycobacterium phage Saguaro]
MPTRHLVPCASRGLTRKGTDKGGVWAGDIGVISYNLVDMSTTPTKRSTRIIRTDVDMATLAAQMSEHSGVGNVEGLIRDYRRYTDLAAALGTKAEVRQAVRAKLDRLIETPGGAWINGARLTKVTRGAKPRRVIRAAVVAQRAPQLWLASRKPTTVLDIKSGLALVGKQAVPPMRTQAEAWKAYEQLNRRATDAKARADTAREQLRELFEAVADVWPLEQLYLTSDGWTLGRSQRLTFDAGRCRELAGSHGVDVAELEVEELSPMSTHYVLVDTSEGEADEIDGQ